MSRSRTSWTRPPHARALFALGLLVGWAMTERLAQASSSDARSVVLPDPSPDPFGSIGSSSLLAPEWIVIGVREKRQLDATRSLRSTGALLLWPRNASGLPDGDAQTVWPLLGVRGARFGESLAIDGNRMLVGEPGWALSSSANRAQGRVQVVDLSADAPLAVEVILRPPNDPGDPSSILFGLEFGSAVDLSGDVALIGAPGFSPSSSTVPSGAAFLYHRSVSPSAGVMWSLTHTFLEPLPASGGVPLGTRFGSTVALHDDEVLVGSPAAFSLPASGGGADLIDAPWHGRVIVFDRQSGSALGSLEAPSPALGDGFGSALALDGDRLAVGAPGDECGFGEVHIFQRDPTHGWMFEATLSAPACTAGAAIEGGWIGFGNSIALSGSRLLVGTGGIRSASAFGHRAALFRRVATLESERGSSPAVWALEQILEGDPSRPTGSPVALDARGALLGEASIGLGQVRYHALTPPLDLDGDGSVGPGDLASLLGAWGPNPGHPAELNGDGWIDQSDLTLLLGGWS